MGHKSGGPGQESYREEAKGCRRCAQPSAPADNLDGPTEQFDAYDAAEFLQATKFDAPNTLELPRQQDDPKRQTVLESDHDFFYWQYVEHQGPGKWIASA